MMLASLSRHLIPVPYPIPARWVNTVVKQGAPENGIVQEVAHKFISNFSQLQPKPVSPSPWRSLLNAEEKQRIGSVWNQHISGMVSKEGNFHRISGGAHNEVWTYDLFPGLVFKPTLLLNAHAQCRTARAVHEYITSQKLFWCESPIADIIPLSKRVALYVETQLPIKMTVSQHMDFWKRIFEHLDSKECSPLFKQNFFELVKQICTYVEMGFWDVGYKNFPEIHVDGTSVCGTDFDKVDLFTKMGVGSGIKKLMAVFPLDPFYEYLVERYYQVGLENDYLRAQMHYENELQCRELWRKENPNIEEPEPLEVPSLEKIAADFQKYAQRE